MLGSHYFGDKAYTEYNNYIIFKNSFPHLLAGKNLYVLYPEQQWDLYKYSPTFALSMGIFAYLPDYIGLSFWNILNAVVLLFSFRMLPFNKRTQSIMLWFVLLELLTSLQNAQSNGLMAGLMVAAYCCMQQKKVFWATLWLVVATLIKVYGAIGFCLFLFYPDKIRFILYAAFWTILLVFLPMIVPSVTLHTLIWQYQNWGIMMAEDQSVSYGVSVMGWLHSWFGLESGKGVVTLVGIVLFLLPFLRRNMYKNEVYKILVLASMLLWVIIFNHKAESPTYIIAVAGAILWYYCLPRKKWSYVFLVLLFLITCMSPTDFYPKFIRDGFFKPYAIKAVPCIVLWCIITIELMLIKPAQELANCNTHS